MLTIWGRQDSSNVQALMWGVAEMGLECERHDVGHRFGGNDSPEFLAMNPNGTVPVLRDGDGPAIWETGAILRYLAGRYGSDAFWPADPVARAQVDKWAEWAKLNIAVGFTVPIFWALVRTAPQDRDAAAIDAAVARFEAKLAIADTQLGRTRFLAGENFTLADIQFGHLLYRYFDIGIHHADLRNIAAYYARLTDRDAFRRHVMVSYDALRVT